MGAGQSIRQEVRIAATPDQVRRALLDFAGQAEWNAGGVIFSIAEPNSNKNPLELRPGDMLRGNLHGTIFYPTVVVSPSDALRNQRHPLMLIYGRRRIPQRDLRTETTGRALLSRTIHMTFGRT